MGPLHSCVKISGCVCMRPRQPNNSWQCCSVVVVMVASSTFLFLFSCFLLLCCCRPIPGPRSDPWALVDSGLISDLRELWTEDNRPPMWFVLFGDAAYPAAAFLKRMYNTDNITPAEEEVNRVHNKARVSIDNIFGNVVSRYRVENI